MNVTQIHQSTINHTVIGTINHVGDSEGRREGKGDIQDSGLSDLGVITSYPVLRNKRGRLGSRRKMLSSVLNMLTLRNLQEVMSSGS